MPPADALLIWGAVGFVFGYGLGYSVGRLDRWAKLFRSADVQFSGVDRAQTIKFPGSALNSTAAPIEIDERKFVAPISTAGLTRADENALGNIVRAEDNIQSAVSKLSQFKGK
ncbi:hypothetical protein EBZ39_01365 [bacterium]|nr:hypothetical protein [bacterium]